MTATIDDPRLAGIPHELRQPLLGLIDTEPDHPPVDLPFSRAGDEGAHRFTLRTLLRPSRRAIGVALLLVGAESVVAQLGPLLVLRAIDQGIVPRNFGVVAMVATAYLVAVIVGFAVTSARIWWTGRLGQQLTKQLRMRVFTHFQRLSQAFFTEERIGRLLTRMTSDIEALGQLLQDGIVNLLAQGFTLAVVTAIMLSLNVRLAAIILIAIVPPMAALTWWFRGASERSYGAVRERIAELLADLQENLSGARVITATNRQHYNEVTHRERVGQYRDTQITSGNVQAIYGPSISMLGSVGQVVVLAIGGAMVLDNQLTVGELTAFVLYLGAFFAPIQELVNLYNAYQSGQAAVTKIADLLDEQPTVMERPDPTALLEVHGAVRFDGVSFGYQPSRPVVRDIDLDIAAGETIALVGETGAGKSTLAKLLTRNYDPDQGRILLDGVSLADLEITALRRAIGVVPQEPFLFSGTLRNNLTIGRPSATDAHVEEVARSLGLGALLDRLGGLDGVVAERGVGLSAGERQLVALARALVPEPPLLVLDEATSNLDLQSERAVQHALDIALQGRTAILVAHRLSTARRADRVVVMDNGQIIEVGGHADLVTADGHYAAMYATWEASSIRPGPPSTS